MVRIVSHYNFFPLFSIYICPWTLRPLLGWATCPIGHFSVFDCMLLPPTATLRRTYFSPHRMPLHMHPACSWWCSHRAGGSSVWTRQTRGLQWWPAGLVGSWVTRREGSENPSAGPPCGSAKERASDISQHHTFTSPDLSSKHAVPDSFSWPLPCPRARVLPLGWHPSFSGGLLGTQMLQTEQDFGGLHSWVSDLACRQLKSPPKRHSPQWGTGVLLRKQASVCETWTWPSGWPFVTSLECHFCAGQLS